MLLPRSDHIACLYLSYRNFGACLRILRVFFLLNVKYCTQNVVFNTYRLLCNMILQEFLLMTFKKNNFKLVKQDNLARLKGTKGELRKSNLCSIFSVKVSILFNANVLNKYKRHEKSVIRDT